MSGNMLSSFLNRDYSPIGLDVGHDSMKMLQLRRRAGAWQVAAGGIHGFSEEARQNPALRWRQVSAGLRSLLSGSARVGFRGRRIVVSMDYELAMIKNTRLPKMPAQELGEAVRWEAAERFPFDVNAGLVRYLVAGDVRQGGEQRQEVLIFAAPDQSLRDTLEAVEQGGCQPVGLDAQPLALARAVEYFMPAENDPDTVQAVLDIGSHSCQVLVLRAGRIVFIKSIEIGSQDMTRAIVEKVGTSAEDTVALRMRLAGGQSGESPGEESKVYRAVTGAMRPVIERLAQEITLCLRYYSVTFRGNRPSFVTVVGGAGHDRLLLHLLGEALGLQVEVGQPLWLCEPSPEVCQWGQGVGSGGPEWAVALGCCLKPIVQAKSRSGAVALPVAAPAAPEAEIAEATAASNEVQNG
jgi:type IV pilus assembly protein PilM